MTKQRGVGRLLVLLLIGLVAVAGCSGDSFDSEANDSADEAATEAPMAPDGRTTDAGGDFDDEAEAQGEGGNGAAGPTAGAVDASQARLLRRDAFVMVEVTDLEAATDSAVAAATDSGGYLSNQQLRPEQSSMTLRVPSEEFDAVLEEISGLGTLREQTVATEDLTEVIVDLEARLETAEASLERTRSFFDAAVTVEDLTTLEAEMANREAQVASLQAQLDNNRSAVALSTINTTFVLDPGVEPPDVVPAEDPLPGVVDALENGWEALRSVGYVIVIAVVWLLPWLPLLAALGFGLRFWLRRRAARPPKPPKVRSASGPPPPPPSAPAASPAPPTTDQAKAAESTG